ncbi:MAG: hypothetical protein K6A35_09570 [bacterium]|nr:hypothetical protein [bacterium]
MSATDLELAHRERHIRRPVVALDGTSLELFDSQLVEFIVGIVAFFGIVERALTRRLMFSPKMEDWTHFFSLLRFAIFFENKTALFYQKQLKRQQKQNPRVKPIGFQRGFLIVCFR